MCDKFVSYLPWTLAPNVITITGVMCVWITVVMQFYLYGIEAKGHVDSWFMVLAGVLYFLSQIFEHCFRQYGW